MLVDGATVIPCIISSDKTQLSTFSGDKQAWPVYLTIGNIDYDLRRKPSEHAQVLIGYIPVVKMDLFPAKERAHKAYELFHTCMSALLEPLKVAGENGVEMLCADGWTRLCFPILASYVADHPEQCLVACCAENRCPKCVVPKDKRGDGPGPDTLRDVQSTLDILAAVSQGLQPDKFTELGLRAVRPFWETLPRCNIFACFTPDILHQLHKGVFKDHTVKWATEASMLSKVEIDDRFKALPPHTSLRHFHKGISLISQWTGREYKEMEKVFLAVIAGTASDGVVTCVRAVLDFIYFAHFEHHTTLSLDAMENALRTFHQAKTIFVDEGIREHFNIPKVHSAVHYVPTIRSHGVAPGYNTEATERLHIDYAKLGYRASSKKGYIKQMVQWLTRREGIDRFSSFLEWSEKHQAPGVRVQSNTVAVAGEAGGVDSGAGEIVGGTSKIVRRRDVVGMDVVAVDDDDGSKQSALTRSASVDQSLSNSDTQTDPETIIPGLSYGECTYSVAKKPPLRNISFDVLVDKYGCTDFLNAMKEFLTQHHIFDYNTFWNSSTPATYSLFKRVHISLPPVPEVSRHGSRDQVRAVVAQPKTGHSPAVDAHFETVLAWKKLPEKGTSQSLLGPNGMFVSLCMRDL